MNSCIVIRGNNFGLPPLVTQRGWIWPPFVTVQPSTSELVPLSRNPSFASRGAALQPARGGGRELLSHSQLPGKSRLGPSGENRNPLGRNGPSFQGNYPLTLF